MQIPEWFLLHQMKANHRKDNFQKLEEWSKSFARLAIPLWWGDQSHNGRQECPRIQL